MKIISSLITRPLKLLLGPMRCVYVGQHMAARPLLVPIWLQLFIHDDYLTCWFSVNVRFFEGFVV